MTPENPFNDPNTAVQETANDRFKESYASWFAGGLIGAVVVHFCLFNFFPQLRAEDMGTAASELESVELPPQVEIPPPPQQIARPATPKVSAADISEDVTIAPTTFESNPVENLPPPPKGGDASDRPSFIPYDVPPKLQNPRQVQQALEQFYPRNLKNQGIGGRVILWVFVNEQGEVTQARVQEGSGYAALDEAARKVAAQMEFTPAQNRDKTTAVWVQQPITFEVQ
jgi:TonB family protein